MEEICVIKVCGRPEQQELRKTREENFLRSDELDSYQNQQRRRVKKPFVLLEILCKLRKRLLLFARRVNFR